MKWLRDLADQLEAMPYKSAEYEFVKEKRITGLRQIATDYERMHAALLPFVSEFERWKAKAGMNSPSRKQWNEDMPDNFPAPQRLSLTMGDFRKACAWRTTHLCRVQTRLDPE